ncbi:MAG: 5'/3'-nucleotidase SurE [Clostridiales bacterium]|nr:5'/3'-nucleotidase SurE [Clostridiales bacterium]
MKLLLSNDDGVFAAGLRALAEELSKTHEIFVSAPDRERSAVSRGMTLNEPLRAQKTRIQGLPDVPAYAVSGTPVDCVRLALGNLFPEPEIVVSGINHGPNLGTDVLYSGTVAAAHEAALLGYQAVAVSCLSYKAEHVETAARVAASAVEYLSKHPLQFGMVLNVNVPAVPFEALRGVKVTPLSVEQYELKYVEREDPFGRKYYWAPRGCTTCSDGMDVDDRWAREGYVTLTPLTYDLTQHSHLREMDRHDLNWIQ